MSKVVLPSFHHHGLTFNLDHACGTTIQTLWPKDEQPSGRVAQPHEENIPKGTP